MMILTDKIGEYTFKITADSFFQVNTLQAEVLYNLLKTEMELDKDKTVLELYSGVGSIGIYLSKEVKDIYAVEIVESAVEAAYIFFTSLDKYIPILPTPLYNSNTVLSFSKSISVFRRLYNTSA